MPDIKLEQEGGTGVLLLETGDALLLASVEDAIAAGPCRYQIWIKDTSGTRVAFYDDWMRLNIKRRLNAPDEHTLILNGDDPDIGSFILDAQIEVWHADLGAVPDIDRYIEYEGFHRTTSKHQDERGQDTFISKGRGYEDLLRRRLIQNYLGTAQAQKDAMPAETAMKEYADEQAGPGATSPPRLFEAGVTTGLTIQADGATGPAWSGNRSYRNLLDVERDIAESSGMWFAVIGTGAAAFEFRVGVLPFGTDRTITGLVAATGLNGAGNRPVIFSNILNTARNPKYSLIRDNEGNRCLSLGSGTGAARALRHVIPAPDPGAASPWNKSEIKTQGVEQDTDAALDAKATATLELAKAREVFDFDVEQDEPFLYGRDYFLGDQITAVFGATVVTRTIVGVDIEVTRREGQLAEEIRLELADVVATTLAAAGPGQIPTKDLIEQLNERIRDLESQDYG